MKISAFLSVISASSDLRACPWVQLQFLYFYPLFFRDQELGDQCESGCTNDLGSCLSTCSDANCQEKCYTNFNNCSFRCPCNIFCPDGCIGCDNEICPEEGCPDEDLADQCEGKCSANLGTCLSGCSNADCQENCFNAYNNCSFRCPCNIFCPDGCVGCDNEICVDGCPDQDLADQCEGKCSADLGTCLSGCSNADCQENCFNNYNNCSFRCPCNIFCPNGCVDCENEICGGDGGNGGARRIIHLADPESTSNLVFFATDEFGDLFEPLDLTLPGHWSFPRSVYDKLFRIWIKFFLSSERRWLRDLERWSLLLWWVRKVWRESDKDSKALARNLWVWAAVSNAKKRFWSYLRIRSVSFYTSENLL